VALAHRLDPEEVAAARREDVVRTAADADRRESFQSPIWNPAPPSK